MSIQDAVRGTSLIAATTLPFVYVLHPVIALLALGAVFVGCLGWAILGESYSLVGLALFTAGVLTVIANPMGWQFPETANLGGLLLPVLAVAGWLGHFLGSIARSYVSDS